MKKTILLLSILTIFACDTDPRIKEANFSEREERIKTREAGSKISRNQPTPTDLQASLERYNLIKRAYWVNGMREKARAVVAPIPDVPLGYVVLFTNAGAVIGQFIVEGKVTSLNSYLTPDSEFYEGVVCTGGGSCTSGVNKWLPDVDGSYGENDKGIFFFTPDGKYIEWNGAYLYSDIPFRVENPVLRIK